MGEKLASDIFDEGFVSNIDQEGHHGLHDCVPQNSYVEPSVGWYLRVGPLGGEEV